MEKTETPVARLEKVVSKIEGVCHPESIFLYGSRARGDFVYNSDFEVGVVLAEENYIGRSALKEAVADADISVFPFRLEDLKNGSPDTPFNKNIYLRELKETARTLSGESIVENLEVPDISDVDLVSDAQFNLGMALSAVLVERGGDVETASPMFYKSCLFAAQALLIKTNQIFPKSYSEIAESARDIGGLDSEYVTLIENAIAARNGEREPETGDLYRNISFINQVVMPSLRDSIQEEAVI